MRKKKRPASEGLGSVVLKTGRIYLTYPEGTPVLPVVTEDDVEDIIDILEQMKKDDVAYSNYETNKE